MSDPGRVRPAVGTLRGVARSGGLVGWTDQEERTARGLCRGGRERTERGAGRGVELCVLVVDFVRVYACTNACKKFPLILPLVLTPLLIQSTPLKPTPYGV